MKVYTGGTFDLLHFGHIELLKACADLGDLYVSLNTDEFITEFKGKPPVMPYKEREEMLRAVRYVTEVIPNTGGADSKPAIISVRPQIVAIGSDWYRPGPDDYLKQMDFTWEWLHEQGITLAFIPRLGQISSTIIKDRVKGAGA